MNTGLKLLIVEDEAIVALNMRMLLSKAGYDVCGVAVNGEQAIEAARRETPDAILLDIRLPGGIDGIEAARRISLFHDAAILFTTGYSDAEMRERAMLLNPVAYLIKPVEIHQIKNALDTLAGR